MRLAHRIDYTANREVHCTCGWAGKRHEVDEHLAMSRVRDTLPQPDPHPTISIQHRCSRMGEHLDRSWRGMGGPGSHPDDLPVPCDECYSIVVTTVAIPWQPNQRERGITS